MDLIQPYRLEMATKTILKDLMENNDHGEKGHASSSTTATTATTATARNNGRHKTLASWWSQSITNSIASNLNHKEHKVLVNLASDEYSAAIDTDLLPSGSKFVKIVFRQEGRVIAVHAKRARGLMVRYIAENQITNLDQVKQFNEDGYTFVVESSPSSSSSCSDDSILTFDRPKVEKSKSKSSNSKRKATVSSSSSSSSLSSPSKQSDVKRSTRSRRK